jgi:formate hydrogenlyase subunit 3/multisubunit Na+/H+ antiporter MnhD subunit
MVYLFSAISLFCGFVALKTNERDVRIAFVIFSLLNLTGVVLALATSDPYAFNFWPADPADTDPIYRR